MKKYNTIEAEKYLNKIIQVHGWIHNIRKMGKTTFVDLRDQSGLLQLVINIPSLKAIKLGHEYVIEAKGLIKNREEKYINKKLKTGNVEMIVKTINVLNQSKELPFDIRNNTHTINEEVRLRYRYLDIRSGRMKQNIIFRHRVCNFIRNYLDNESFVEVETPILTKGTPEGAREFLVPSRIYPGKFYVLPQSPQQFKQLLMIGGIEKYYQIAKAYRDEDQRLDRQAEFTQLDIEMSFIKQSDILELTEKLLIELVNKLTDKKIIKIPFPRLTYEECIRRYNNDKPDIRINNKDSKELAFVWIIRPPMFTKKLQGKGLDCTHHPFTSPREEDIKLLDKRPLEIKAEAYDLVLNGYEIGGGSIRIHDSELQKKIFKLLGLKNNQIIQKFNHMLEAFKYGAPPHGGIALGLDRLLMILCNELNIREVITFPKTGDSKDLMMDAPSLVEDSLLKDVHIKVVKKRKS